MKKTNDILFYQPDTSNECVIPFVDCGISAGFTSPAGDYTVEGINLNKVLMKDRTNTYVFYAKGNLTFGKKIIENDIVLFDTSIKLLNNDLVICKIDGVETVGQVRIKGEEKLLISGISKPINLTDYIDYEIYGIVTVIIRKHIIDLHDSYPDSDFVNGNLIDLNKVLIKNKPTTFITYVKGYSMVRKRVKSKDFLLIDKSLEPLNNYLVSFSMEKHFALKMIRYQKDKIWLYPANSSFQPIQVTKENEFDIWGVVTYSIRRQRVFI